VAKQPPLAYELKIFENETKENGQTSLTLGNERVMKITTPPLDKYLHLTI
jgi:hypothetical protein